MTVHFTGGGTWEAQWLVEAGRGRGRPHMRANMPWACRKRDYLVHYLPWALSTESPARCCFVYAARVFLKVSRLRTRCIV